jgi:hypothetical protein
MTSSRVLLRPVGREDHRGLSASQMMSRPVFRFHLPPRKVGQCGHFQPQGSLAAELLGSSASRLYQSSLPSSGPDLHGEAGGRLIRRTAVVRTRMPGGVGGVASRDVPLSRFTGAALSNTFDNRMRAACGLSGPPLCSRSCRGGDVPRDRPQKRRHLAGDRGNHHGEFFASGGEPAITGAQANLRLPGDRANRLGRPSSRACRVWLTRAG